MESGLTPASFICLTTINALLTFFFENIKKTSAVNDLRETLGHHKNTVHQVIICKHKMGAELKIIPPENIQPIYN